MSRIAGGVSLFVNAQRSWACVRRRQHCFRNLDVDYLTIKAFLLERFLHDALYEAPTAEVFNEFLDIRPAPAAQVSFASSPSLPAAVRRFRFSLSIKTVLRASSYVEPVKNTVTC